LCFICSKLGINVVEDEKHVLLQCPGYADIRQSIFKNICELNSNFINMSDDEKFLYIFIMKMFVILLPKSVMKFYLSVDVFFIRNQSNVCYIDILIY
jgi:hypothetical protein